jgi:hypothetical protein
LLQVCGVTKKKKGNKKGKYEMPIVVDDDDDVMLLGIKPSAEIPAPVAKPAAVASPPTNSKRTLLTMPKTPATPAAATATSETPTASTAATSPSATDIGRKRSHDESNAMGQSTPSPSSNRPAQAVAVAGAGVASSVGMGSKPTTAPLKPTIQATTLTEKVLAKGDHGPAGQDPSKPSFYTKGGDGVSKMDLLAFDFDRKRRGELPPSAVAVNVIVNGPLDETPKDRKIPKTEAPSPYSGVATSSSTVASKPAASVPTVASGTPSIAAVAGNSTARPSAPTPQRTLSATAASPSAGINTASSAAAPKGQMKLDSFFAKFACQKKPAAPASDAPSAE